MGEGSKLSGTKSIGRRVVAVLLLLLAAAAAACLVFYFKRVDYYRTHFQKNVYINGISVEGMTSNEASGIIYDNIEDYSLRLRLRYLPTEIIDGEDVDLSIEYSDTPAEILMGEDPYKWPFNSGKRRDYSIAKSISFDEGKLLEITEGLDCLKPENVSEPKDAYISESPDRKSFIIVPEVKGNLIDKDKLFEEIKGALWVLKPEIELEDTGVYAEPEIKAADPKLNESLNELNKYMSASITLDVGNGIKEICNWEVIREMIVEDSAQGGPAFSDELMRGYVESLAARYDTAGTKRRFETVYGSFVEVEGLYGNRTDIEAECERLKSEIASGTVTERKPVYVEPSVPSDGDIGEDYIEVNLTAQRLFLIRNGQEIMNSDIVSGCEADGHGTASGIFPVLDMTSEGAVEERGYPVNFSVEFGEGTAFYDASWRSAFGGNIYKSSGTGGGICLPYSKAKILYENTYKGMPVICYRTADEALPEESVDSAEQAEENGGLYATPSEAFHFQEKDI